MRMVIVLAPARLQGLPRTLRALLMVVAAASCAGCFGFLVDKPYTTDIRNPVPSKASGEGPLYLLSRKQRWACERSSERYSKEQFLNAWGQPREKVPTPQGETWIYEDSRRWCGIWVSFIVPVPLLLPICETFDHVEFEGELAVRSKSRRADGYGIGLTFYMFAPIPLMVTPARATEGNPMVDRTMTERMVSFCRTPEAPSAPGKAPPDGNASQR